MSLAAKSDAADPPQLFVKCSSRVTAAFWGSWFGPW